MIILPLVSAIEILKRISEIDENRFSLSTIDLPPGILFAVYDSETGAPEYILDYYGYGFNGIGSLEEYFAYDPDEYYASLQMGLPALYYSGRENPPHSEICVLYFLKMVELYSKKVYELSKASETDVLEGSLPRMFF